ncbi:unnamed protein product [Aspergillus oryzae]|uniref:Unnamed protein product n=2 Tax=Aspergillus oryzae TaxID=5062 RepID=A0AAN4YMC7_ASPOZ|nr:unnamed protein product [Aspergillus oryzae]GMF87803.1 unnamed protein product [Aspergillus oryzae]GMG29140.1 unnamed protein product [Aspergillus oryzae]GMG51857.1 unnamed protein product [Aspergillus oryzae var. brunneus]
MRLGSGFNSYTHELCLDDAVKKGTGSPPKLSDGEGVAQSVVFKTSVIDKMSDITDALNGSFINSNKIKDADINFLISVKVINQTVTDNALTEFAPIDNLPAEKFTEVYGDTFISGFQEGGEFNAVISIKVKDKNQVENIKADEKPKAENTETYAVAPNDQNNEQGNEQQGGNEAGEETKKKEDGADSPTGLAIKGNAEVEKNLQDLFQENETTVSVSYSGGGQDLKKRTFSFVTLDKDTNKATLADDDWNVKNMRAAALRFPALVAKTPVRTNAVLTKYTALRSFHTQKKDKNNKEAVPLSYENASVYTSILEDAFLDYKNIYKEIRLSEGDLASGKKEFEASTAKESTGKENTSKESTGKESTYSGRSIYNSRHACANNAESDGTRKDATPQAHIATEPFAPTLAGFESAKCYIRRNMNLIVREVRTPYIVCTIHTNDIG